MLLLVAACAGPDLGHEYTEPIDILDATGAVQARGWARTPLFGFDRAAVPAPASDRVREWDYYEVRTPDFAVSFTLAAILVNGTPLVLGAVTLHDFAAGEAHTASYFAVDTADALMFDPDPDGTYAPSFGTGSLAFTMDAATRVLAFTAAEGEGTVRIGPRRGDSVAVVTPYDADGQFFYEVKDVGLSAEGVVTLDGRTWTIPPGTPAVLDFSRNAMPAEVTWEWATAVGTVDGRRVGINLGSVHGDESAGTPAAVVVDGVLHKLGVVDADFDVTRPLRPWTFTSADARCDLVLTPDHDYVEHTVTDLGAYQAELWKLYGAWSGTVALSDGSVLDVAGLLGSAEHFEVAW